MIKTILAATAAATISTSAMAYTIPAEMADTNGLKVLAETGSGDVLAKEGRGMSFHVDVMSMDDEWVQKAKTQLMEGERLAPHYFKGWDGTYYVMVAPYADVTDHFIRVKPYKEIVIPDSVTTERKEEGTHVIIGGVAGNGYTGQIYDSYGEYAYLGTTLETFSSDIVASNAQVDSAKALAGGALVSAGSIVAGGAVAAVNAQFSGTNTSGDTTTTLSNGDLTAVVAGVGAADARTGYVEAHGAAGLEFSYDIKSKTAGSLPQIHIHPEEVDRWDYSEQIAMR